MTNDRRAVRSVETTSGDAKANADLIRRPEDLQSVCETLRAAGVFGFDSEFIRERSYLPQLCLVQVATRDTVFLIDPFELDLDPLWQLLSDRSIRKVLHAAVQDLEMCYLASGRLAANVFDVQVAAGMVGLPYPLAYGKLVQRIAKVTLQQEQTFSEWSQRPLSAKQLRYAADDVRHLVIVHDTLTAQLDALGRTAWLEQEMTLFEDESLYAVAGNELYTRVHGWQQMRSTELAVLQELALWREQQAKSTDTPPRSFLKDTVLTTLARRMPQTLGALEDAKGFPRPLAKSQGRDVLDAIKRGKATDRNSRPPQAPPPRRTEDPLRKLMTDLAAAIGQALCISGELNHGLLASRNDYADLVRALMETGSDPRNTRLGSGWRSQFAGAVIEDILAGRKGMRVDLTGPEPRLVFG